MIGAMPEPPRPARPDAGRRVPVVGAVLGGAVVVVVVVGVLMAIGLRGGTTRDDADGLARDVEAFTMVVLSSRPPDRAYDHLSAECRDQISVEAFAAAVEEVRRALARRLDVDLGALAVAEVETRGVAGGRGEAAVAVEEIGVDEIPVGDPFELVGWSRWAYEAGLWRAIDCADPGGLVPVAGP